MVTVELTVGKEEINAGIGGSITSCPIALAAVKAGFDKPKVADTFSFSTPDYIYVTCREHVSLPGNAAHFIDSFDDWMEGIEGSCKPKPIKVRLRIPNKIAKLIKIKRRFIVAA